MTFEIITSILFSIDIKHKIGKLLYKTTRGNYEEMDLEKFMMTLTDDCFESTRKIHSILFPFIIRRNWFHPHNAIHENILLLWRVMKEFLDNNDDPNSVYSKVLKNNPNIDKTTLMKDMIFFFFAGHESTSRNLSSIMYLLKKHPRCYDKCYKEVYEGIQATDRTNVKNLITFEKLNELEYVHYCIKEALRYDNPASAIINYFTFLFKIYKMANIFKCTLGYQALDNINICGVPLSKGSKIFLSIHGNHYNLKQWKDPEKFIPERFDPENEYFNLPGESIKKGRSPYSFIPFSFGLRNCAGKSFASLEAKTICSYMLMKFDYEIDPEQSENEFIRFSGGSQFKTKIKITKIY